MSHCSSRDWPFRFGRSSRASCPLSCTTSERSEKVAKASALKPCALQQLFETELVSWFSDPTSEKDPWKGCGRFHLHQESSQTWLHRTSSEGSLVPLEHRGSLDEGSHLNPHVDLWEGAKPVACWVRITFGERLTDPWSTSSEVPVKSNADGFQPMGPNSGTSIAETESWCRGWLCLGPTCQTLAWQAGGKAKMRSPGSCVTVSNGARAVVAVGSLFGLSEKGTGHEPL